MSGNEPFNPKPGGNPRERRFEMTTGVHKLQPQGTNSTMFTECCDTAICDDERCCPNCKKEIIGHDAHSNHERGIIRWKYAISHWK
jgi:hypothetical protein